MTKNLVQELRELAAEKDDCITIRGVLGGSCSSTTCVRCASDAIGVIADRIEAEYDPKPEPDTLEKVAKDMDATLRDIAYLVTHFKGKNIAVIVEGYRDRLEALGVTFDD